MAQSGAAAACFLMDAIKSADPRLFTISISRFYLVKLAYYLLYIINLNNKITVITIAIIGEIILILVLSIIIVFEN